MSQSHHVVVRAKIQGQLSLCRINVFVINDATSGSGGSATPDFFFPISDAVTSVKENSPAGTFVFKLPFVSAGKEPVTFWTESDLFSVDPGSGDIFTRAVLDYESAGDHHLQVFGKTGSGQSVCNVRVLVEGVDEFSPVFEKPRYLFNLRHDAAPGDVLGKVQATDRDSGPDGQVFFSLASPNPYFSVNPTQGTVVVSRPPDTGLLPETGHRRIRRAVQEVRLVVEAKSRRIGSLATTVPVFVSVDEMALPARIDPNDGSASVQPWVTGVVVGVLFIFVAIAVAAFFFCKVKKARDAKERKLRLTGNVLSKSGANPTIVSYNATRKYFLQL
jgi:hypothetical protein